MLSLHDNPADRGQAGGANNGPIRRIARSKNGCVTCRRRKVRCDEQRPRCSHCERLNLHCQWRPLIHTTSAPGTSRRASSTPSGSTRLAHAELPAGRRSDIQSPDNLGSIASPAGGQLLSLQTGQPGAGVEHFFDYASFMWSDAAGLWGQLGMSAGDESMDASLRLGTPTTTSVSTDTGRRLDLTLRDAAAQERQMASPQSSQYNNTVAAPASIGLSVFRGEDSDLLTYFVHTVVPPILAEVETQKKWASMRRVLISMAAASTMVRYAILAFSGLLRCRRETPWSQVNQHYYENATKELDAAGELPSPERHSSQRQSLLATLFFLCYIDILEERNETTHANLKHAYTIFRQGDRRGFHPVEMQLLSWIRLLDARAVSAGGEGLFLTDQDETLLVQPSPGSLHDSTNDAVEGSAGRAADLASGLLHAAAGPDRDIEDVLFELLYQPGIVFYQKVQSFMGRISKIDPWHRSRGTVEDETEVMNIAAGILRDLRALLADGCPALMPHAVAGKLKAPYVSRYLAFTITRAFRTYLSNYYASKLHLHRVAYRHLPLSSESKDALAQIRHLARLMVDDAGPVPDEQHEHQQHTDMTSPMAAGAPEGVIISDTRFASAVAEDASTSVRGQPQQDEQEQQQQQQHSQQPQLPAQATLPVNMLWPLLMWGTEEKDPAERDWIRDQILRMEKVASNARATAQVLEEVQRRQDATNTRQDVRAVMHTVFDSCWAIV